MSGLEWSVRISVSVPAEQHSSLARGLSLKTGGEGKPGTGFGRLPEAFLPSPPPRSEIAIPELIADFENRHCPLTAYTCSISPIPRSACCWFSVELCTSREIAFKHSQGW